MNWTGEVIANYISTADGTHGCKCINQLLRKPILLEMIRGLNEIKCFC